MWSGSVHSHRVRMRSFWNLNHDFTELWLCSNHYKLFITNSVGCDDYWGLYIKCSFRYKNTTSKCCTDKWSTGRGGGGHVTRCGRDESCHTKNPPPTLTHLSLPLFKWHFSSDMEVYLYNIVLSIKVFLCSAHHSSQRVRNSCVSIEEKLFSKWFVDAKRATYWQRLN